MLHSDSRNAADRFPASPMQRSMVLASLRETRARPYILQVIGVLHEAVDAARLREAWRCVTQRHPALRTRFFSDDQEGLVQQVFPEAGLDWEETDWRGLEGPEQHRKLDEFLEADLARGFPLGAPTFSRLRLIRLADDDHRLIWTLHHALCDGGALFIVLREVFACYEAPGAGWDIVLDPGRSFRDHAEWLHAQDWTAHQPFWTEQLRGVTEPTRLALVPLRQLGAGEPTGTKRRVVLSETETQRLALLAEHHGVTMNTLAQAAWALLLSRYTRSEIVVFGATRACRYSSVEGANEIVGNLINTVPLRVDVPPTASLGAWLRTVRSQWVALRDHEHTPLALIQAWSEMPPGTPPFESVLIYDHASLATRLRALGGDWAHRHFEGWQQLDSGITLTVRGRPQVTLQIAYDRRRMDDEQAARMMDHLRILLNGLADHPDACLADLPMLTPAEQETFAAWNETATAYPHDRCLHELIEAQAAVQPETMAVVAGTQRLAYSELNRRANRLARLLRAHGVGPEEIVGVYLARSPEVVIAMLAVSKAGGAFLLLDPGLPSARLQTMLNDSRPRLVITRQPFAGALAAWRGEMLALDRIDDALTAQSDDDLAPMATPEHLAYVIYTSGSTGRPKGVLVTHRSIVNHTVASGRHFSLTPRDRRLQFGAVTTDFFIAEIANYLAAGATVVMRDGEAPPSIADFLQDIEVHGITVVGMPSTYWHAWVDALDLLPMPASLRLVITGMEKVQAESYARWQQRVGTRIRWCNVYGPTEATGTATVYEAGADPDLADVPIGKPIANATVYVLGHDGHRLPVGVPGELYIGGAGVARGYLNDPTLTAERFVPDPFGPPGGRRYRTGDLACFRPDGHLIFLGRVDRQIKIRGFRVEPEEIEAVLATHPAVGLAAVVAHGEGSDTWLAGYFTKERAVETDELRRYLSDHLPGHMVPAVLVPLDAMPLTRNQKIDRQALPIPARRAAAGSAAPRTPVEENLAAVWAKVLGVESVGVDDNFFDLGGDSLKAMKVALALRRVFGVEIPLHSLFDWPTIAQLAEVVLVTFAEHEPDG